MDEKCASILDQFMLGSPEYTTTMRILSPLFLLVFPISCVKNSEFYLYLRMLCVGKLSFDSQDERPRAGYKKTSQTIFVLPNKEQQQKKKKEKACCWNCTHLEAGPSVFLYTFFFRHFFSFIVFQDLFAM